MTAPAYATDLTNIVDCDSAITYYEFTGMTQGGVASQETDYHIQGTSCCSAITTKSGLSSIGYNNTTPITIAAGNVVLFWQWYGDPCLLAAVASGGQRCVIGTDLSNWKVFAEFAGNEDVSFVRAPQPKGAAYYDKVFAASKDMSRYDQILRMAANWTWGRVLDVCCGTGELARYVTDYHGIDFSKEAVGDKPNTWVGDVFQEDLAGYDTYVVLEALEHLDDRALLRRLPPDADVVFSVPSFADSAHLRTYNERILHLRFDDLLRVQRVVRFNWDGATWNAACGPTPNYILLARGSVRPRVLGQ